MPQLAVDQGHEVPCHLQPYVLHDVAKPPACLMTGSARRPEGAPSSFYLKVDDPESGW